jgi:hypothetical protein
MTISAATLVAECARVARDVAAGVICGATMGLFLALAGSWF